jgi:N-hydroxyarylamine O-acetyltransferase
VAADIDVGAYLARIGIHDPAGPPDADQLRRLHAAHVSQVPFENLSVHNGEGIDLDPAALFDKIVGRRRGGFCYELNGLFAALLESLGYPVARCAARVWDGKAWGIPFDHLALIVETPEPWLVDVGFGAHSRYPLRVSFDVDQPDPGGVFRLREAGDGQLDVYLHGGVQYRLERMPRPLTDFEIGAWWNSTSPRSHFTRGVVCTLPTEHGRVTISNDLLIQTVDGVRTETRLPPAGRAEVYRRYFGIDAAVPARPLLCEPLS